MAVFTSSQIEADVDEAGIHLSSIGGAIMIWTAMQQREKVTVAECMLAFNTTQEVIRDAVESAMWILIVGAAADPAQQFLETDGE